MYLVFEIIQDFYHEKKNTEPACRFFKNNNKILNLDFYSHKNTLKQNDTKYSSISQFYGYNKIGRQ